VLENRDLLGQSLRPGGVDVVEADDLEHGRSHEASHGRALEEPEYSDGHDSLPRHFPRPAPARGADVRAVDEGQPVEVDAEEEDEEETGEEGGQREADEGKGGGELIEEGVRAYGRVDADGKSDEEPQELGRAEHEEGGGEALHDEGGDIDAAHEGEAPVALEHGGHPADVADGNRIVQPELRAKVGPDLWGDIWICRELFEGIAGRQREHGEEDETDAQQGRDGDQEASEEVLGHCSARAGDQAGGPGPPKPA
jgi:hypothetical protein